MPVKTSAVPPEVFQLKATLLGTMAEIWRRVGISTVVSDGPSRTTCAWLHLEFEPRERTRMETIGKDAENIIAVRLG